MKYMKLIVIAVLKVLGPKWAAMLNSNLNVVDNHDHNTENGKKIPVSGLDIDEDLTINDNKATNVKSVALEDSSPENDLSVYIENGNLYYKNSPSSTVQITNNDQVLSSTDGISRSLTVLNVSSDTTLADNTTISEVIIEASSNITLTLPGDLAIGRFIVVKDVDFMASTYNIIIDGNGLNINGQPTYQLSKDGERITLIRQATHWDVSSFGTPVDTATFVDSSVTTPKIANNTIQLAKLATKVKNSSPSTGNAANLVVGSSYVDIPNLSVTINRTGRPVKLMLVPDGTSNVSSFRDTKVIADLDYAGLEVSLNKNSSSIFTSKLQAMTKVGVGGSFGGSTNLYRVLYGNGTLAAYTQSQVSISLDGGKNWNNYALPTYMQSGRTGCTTFANGLFVFACGRMDNTVDATGGLYTSTNGISYSFSAVSMYGIAAIAYNPSFDTWLFMPTGAPVQRTWSVGSTPDASQMTANRTTAGFPSSFSAKSGCLYAGSGYWMGITTGNAVVRSTSSNGGAWSTVSSGVSVPTDMVFGNSKWVLVGTNQSSYSSDGVTWTAMTTPSGNWTSVTWNGSSFIAVADNGKIMRGDGLSWKEMKNIGHPYKEVVPYDNNDSVAVSWFGAMGMSSVITNPDNIKGNTVPGILNYTDTTVETGSTTYSVSIKGLTPGTSSSLEYKYLKLVAFEI